MTTVRGEAQKSEVNQFIIWEIVHYYVFIQPTNTYKSHVQCVFLEGCRIMCGVNVIPMSNNIKKCVKSMYPETMKLSSIYIDVNVNLGAIVSSEEFIFGNDIPL